MRSKTKKSGQELKGKKFIVFLKNKRKYTCEIVSIDDLGFSCIDKFGKHIYIIKDSIECMEEVNKNE